MLCQPRASGHSPLQEFVEQAAVGEPCPAHPDVLLQPQVLDLVLHPVQQGGTTWDDDRLAGHLKVHLRRTMCPHMPLVLPGLVDCSEGCSFWRKAGPGHISMGGSPSLGSVGSLLPALLPVPGFLGLVGFDAADVVWGALHERVHQVVGLFLVQGSTSVASKGVVGALPLPPPQRQLLLCSPRDTP